MKNKNDLIIKIITGIADVKNDSILLDFPDIFSKSPVTETYESGGLVKDVKLSDLDYSTSKLYLTKATLDTLKKILGDPKDFSKLTTSKKRSKQSALERLNKDEYVWKATTKRTVHDSSLCHKLYPEGYEKFKFYISNFIFPKPGETEKGSRKFLPHKARLLIRGLSEDFVKEGHTFFAKILSIPDKEFDEVFSNVQISWVFSDVCRIILKKAHDNLFNKTMRRSKKYQDIVIDDMLVAIHTAVEYDFRKVFAMYLLNLVVTHISEKEGADVDYEALGKIVYRHLAKDIHLYKPQNHWWMHYCDGVRSILFAIRDCGVFKFDTNTVFLPGSRKIKSIQKFVVPLLSLKNDVPYTNFPRVFKADPIRNETILDRIKPIFKGDAKISFSDKFERTLNFSQDKKFTINVTYLGILKKLFNSENSDFYGTVFNSEDLPFPFDVDVQSAKIRLDRAEDLSVLRTENRYVAEQIQMQLAGIGATCKLSFRQRFFLSGSSVLEMDVRLLVHKLKRDFLEKKLSRKMGATVLALAECYKGFPVYITDSICSRGRLFPEQPVISRTSGSFKHLLQEYKARKVSLAGFVALLQAYYKPSLRQSEGFSNFIKNTTLAKKDGFKKLTQFFKENPLDFSSIKNKLLYFMLLHAEILKVIKTGKTGVMIEIDQVASGVTILSCFIRNKIMARAANVIGGDASDPYEYCREKFLEFYGSDMTNRDERAFTFLASDRKVHKYALMCFCYSQTHFGRSSDFIERFERVFQTEASEEEKEVFEEFAVKYKDFIHYVFPNTNKQIDIILKVVDIVARELGYLPFKNLQGDTFMWSFYKYTTKVRSAYNSISHVADENIHRSYQYQEIDGEDVDGEGKRRMKKCFLTFKRKALSYMVHCIDASLIHRFILKMREEKNCSINHLHDCVLVHPNAVNDMYDVIEEIYKSDELYCMADRLFFDHVANHVSEDTRVEIEKLKKEFKKGCDEFANELKFANPRHLYDFEG
jgi:DNA-dependent RNA polymerase